jgi:hypothetical protein
VIHTFDNNSRSMCFGDANKYIEKRKMIIEENEEANSTPLKPMKRIFNFMANRTPPPT